MKVAVLIPTLNEANNISKITNIIDKSLNKFFPDIETYIVNFDSHSVDKTREIFLSCNTINKKFSFDSGKCGKGHNIIGFFKFCLENDIDFGATIDADITSVDDSWIEKLFSPLLKGNDYVTPIYKRSKYDGNLTNQLVFPIVNLFSKNVIRQAIGGEFAFNKKFMKLFLTQYNNYAFNYGIDICMTLCAINNNLQIKSVELGQKIHRSGINNMKSMFREVAPALFNNINYKKIFNLNITSSINYFYFCFFDEIYVKRQKGTKLKEEASKELKENRYSDIIQELKLIDFSYVSQEKWVEILAYFLKRQGNITNQEYEILTNLFVVRTVTFWEEIENISLEEAEKIIFDYIYMLKEKVVKDGKCFKSEQ